MNTQEVHEERQSRAEFLASVDLLSALTRVDIERLAAKCAVAAAGVR